MNCCEWVNHKNVLAGYQDVKFLIPTGSFDELTTTIRTEKQLSFTIKQKRAFTVRRCNISGFAEKVDLCDTLECLVFRLARDLADSYKVSRRVPPG